MFNKRNKSDFDFCNLTPFEKRSIREYNSWKNSSAPLLTRIAFVEYYMKILYENDLLKYVGIDLLKD